jgi:hypothetical protein
LIGSATTHAASYWADQKFRLSFGRSSGREVRFGNGRNSYALLGNHSQDDPATKNYSFSCSILYLDIRWPSGSVEEATSNAVESIPLFQQIV